MADDPPNSSRFTSTTQDAEDVLKGQTVGLVHLSDFRKRRAEALEQSNDSSAPGSGATTPEAREGRDLTPKPAGFKKRKKGVKKVGLSFGDEEEEEEEGREEENKNGRAGKSTGNAAATEKSRSATPATSGLDDGDNDSSTPPATRKRLRPNAAVSFAPKALTKTALARDAALKDSLRKQYLQLQEAVRATEFILPFVFFEGKDMPGGKVRVKKGDFVWLFLERARKVGAELAEGDGSGVGKRREWARIGVDDLMVVRETMSLPHYQDFHSLILNKSTGYNASPLFSYSAEPTQATPTHLLPSTNSETPRSTDPEPNPSTQPESALKTASQLRAPPPAPPSIPDSSLEGYHDDPSQTKVVDRRWYERHKHIYPMSVWEEFDAKKSYTGEGAAAGGGRKDRQGNAFFFGT